MKKKAVVLLSGGMDSAVVLAIAKKKGFDCHAITFSYGQRHRVELNKAKIQAERQNAAEHKIFELNIGQFGGSALTENIEVPKSSADEKSIPVTYVPARNLIFLSIAAGYAETIGADDIFIGVSSVDYSGYPDCRPEFIDAMNRTVNLATKKRMKDLHLSFTRLL